MAHPEQAYLDLLRSLLEQGDERIDRTGVGTRARFGQTLRFDLQQGFPILTTKRVYWRTAFKEMLWMLAGGTNIRPLLEQNVSIWTDWPLQRYRQATGEEISQKDFEQRVVADEDFAAQWGELGPVYGKQWRRWRCEDGREIDQIAELIQALRDNPGSRRLLFDGWNVGELHRMALPPCHKHYQFFVSSDGRLHGGLVQRSADAFLGLPFNLINMALLTHLLAEQTGYRPGEIVWFGFDVHLYLNHLPQAQRQLQREPRPQPQLIVRRKPDSLFDYGIDDLDLEDYDPHPPIAADVAV
jgi:thymidylate synthase